MGVRDMFRRSNKRIYCWPVCYVQKLSLKFPDPNSGGIPVAGRELKSCQQRLNSEYLYYQKNMFFLHCMCCVNTVLTSVVRVFIHSLFYSKLCNFVCVSLYDSKFKIKSCVTAKFAASIVS